LCRLLAGLAVPLTLPDDGDFPPFDRSFRRFPCGIFVHLVLSGLEDRKTVEVAPGIINGFYWSGSNRQSLSEKTDRQWTFGGTTIIADGFLRLWLLEMGYR